MSTLNKASSKRNTGSISGILNFNCLYSALRPEGKNRAGPKPRVPPQQLLQRYLQSLQRLQEGNQLVLLRSAERTVIVDDVGGFTGMAQNGFIPGEVSEIMH